MPNNTCSPLNWRYLVPVLVCMQHPQHAVAADPQHTLHHENMLLCNERYKPNLVLPMIIADIALQAGTAPERLLAIVDGNRDLHLVSVLKRTAAKISSNVDCVVWHDSCGMLAGMVDNRLVVWYCPGVVSVDKDLLEATKCFKSDR